MVSKTSYVVQAWTGRSGWIDIDEQPAKAPALKLRDECRSDELEGSYRVVERVTTDTVVE